MKYKLSDDKRTKIIATVGPSTESYEIVKKLIDNGANGLRMNFSHISHESCEQYVAWIRKASKSVNRPVAIIQDLQGPKIRLGEFDGIIPVEKNQQLQLKYKADYLRSGYIPVQYDISKKVERGQRLLFNDGRVRATVTSVKEGVVHVRVENEGVLLEKRGINLPDTNLSGDVLTEKDKTDLAFGTTINVDYVAMSFVQSADDITKLRHQLKNIGSDAKVIAKIETRAALDNIESIIQESDAVMIARGDLAVETSNEVVPIAQRQIVGLCRKYAKTVIVATQMLTSMVEDAVPTRAEVSDVSTAAIIGADSVMLSEETALGKHPVDAVSTMKRILQFSEANRPMVPVFTTGSVDTKTKQSAICDAVVQLANDVDAEAIVAETKSGATARLLSARRPENIILAVTFNERVGNQLSLVYGVTSFVRSSSSYNAGKLRDWLLKSKTLKKGDTIVAASGKHPGVVGSTDTIKVRVL